MTETKADVFEELLKELCSQMRLSADDYDHVFRIARASKAAWRKRYVAATDDTPEQAKCPYCHGDALWISDIVHKGHAGHYRLHVADFDGTSDSMENIIDGAPYGQYRKFSYCPMCGRKLE